MIKIVHYFLKNNSIVFVYVKEVRKKYRKNKAG